MPPEDRLQPSLLDRLIDDDPQSTRESRDRRVFSFAKLREAVIRDMNWLLNTGRLSEVQDLSAFPQVATSVVNFGLPDLAGRTASSLQVGELERLIRDAITDFEPRILPDELEVRVIANRDQMSRAALEIDIRAALWSQPLPQELYLRTEVDLETGHFTINEQPGKEPA